MLHRKLALLSTGWCSGALQYPSRFGVANWGLRQIQMTFNAADHSDPVWLSLLSGSLSASLSEVCNMQQCKAPNSGRGSPASTSLSQAAGQVPLPRHPAARSNGIPGHRYCWHGGQQQHMRDRVLCASAKGFGGAAKKAPQPPIAKPGKDAKARIDFQDLMITWDKTLEHLYEVTSWQ